MTPNKRIISALIAFCGFVCATSAFCQPNDACSLRDLKGSYGFTVKGNNLDLKVGYILTGLFQSDGNGNFTGTGKQTVGVRATGAMFTGTYQVMADCTGSAHLQFSDGLQSELYFVLVDDGQEAIILDVGTGVLEGGNAKRVHRRRPKL